MCMKSAPCTFWHFRYIINSFYWKWDILICFKKRNLPRFPAGRAGGTDLVAAFHPLRTRLDRDFRRRHPAFGQLLPHRLHAAPDLHSRLPGRPVAAAGRPQRPAHRFAGNPDPSLGALYGEPPPRRRGRGAGPAGQPDPADRRGAGGGVRRRPGRGFPAPGRRPAGRTSRRYHEITPHR